MEIAGRRDARKRGQALLDEVKISRGIPGRRVRVEVAGNLPDKERDATI